jgi:putative aminopeptidase FrvX
VTTQTERKTLNTLALLKDLSQHTGPSGRETEINQKIAAYWQSLTDELKTDALGNLIAVKYGKNEERRSVMLAAHMDEIALIVTGIKGEFIRINNLAGVDRRVILGSEVNVHGRRIIPGVIGPRPPHTLAPQDRDQIPSWQELFVDVGLAEEEIRKWVRVGDHITPQQPLLVLKNKRVAGKALDNRASVVALTLALQLLQQQYHSWDVIAVATVQEEIGLFGATTSAYGIAPDIAIAIDVTFANQYNDNGTGAFDLDKGPTIGIGPNLHPKIIKRLRETAETNEIPFMLEPLSGSSGTDAWAMQVAREGIPTGLLSIPVRYMHQPVETASLNDIERTGRLLSHFIAHLEPDFTPTWEDESV